MARCTTKDGDSEVHENGSQDALNDAVAESAEAAAEGGDGRTDIGTNDSKADVMDAFDGSSPIDAMADADGACPVEAYVATMNGANVPTPVSTTSTGSARVVLRCDGVTVDYTFHLAMETPSDVTMGHIHRAPLNMTGPIALMIFPPPPPDAGPDFAGRATLKASDVTLLQSGGLYADVHTMTHPAGEIRGWFIKE